MSEGCFHRWACPTCNKAETSLLVRIEKLGQELETQARNHARMYRRLNAQVQDERTNRSAFKRGAAAAFGIIGMAEAIARCEAEKHWAVIEASCDAQQKRFNQAMDDHAEAWRFAETDDRSKDG